MSLDLQSGFDELLSGLAQISSQSEESVAEDQITQLAVGEVRNCAVLFADIKGFTALSEKLRAEEVKLIIDHSFKIFTQEIKRYNGLVDKYIGDCIMAVFGSEVAGDNDSELAIRAGLSMLDRLEQINSLLKPKGIELGLRIGVNYGEVVYGSVGEGRDKDTTVMGDTVNTAQRMEANAPVNGLLITAGTKKYLGDIFIYEDRDPIYVKNKAEPVEVAVVRGINHCSVERWQRSAFAGRTKFVGRSEQIELLISLYEKCERGGEGNQLVLIEGVPGIGKSRLAYEFRQVLKERSRPGLRALKTGNPSYTTRPYYAITGLLRQYWEMDELEKADVTREKLTLGIEELARYSADQAACASTLPIIGNLLGLEYDDPRLKMDAASLETERKIAFKHLFSAIAEREKSLSACPLLIIVDDIQWADDASLSGLLTIASEVESSLPVFLLALSRNDTPVPEDWKEFAGFFSMELHPLSAADCAEIVSSMMPGINMPARLRDLVASRSQGNPFFLEEIVHLLAERGIFRETEEGWRISGRIESLEIPSSVNSIILSRIDRLDKESKDLIQKASVLGMEFVFAVLDRIMARTVRGHSQESLRNILKQLSEKQLVFAEDSQSETSDDKFFFRNLLIQEAAYNTLLRTNKRTLHSLAAEAIENLFSERLDDFYSVLAYHYERAELYSKAVEYYQKAGKHRSDLSRFAAAKEMYSSALALLSRAGLPEEERIRTELDLSIALLECCNSLGLYRNGLATAEGALALAMERGDKAQQARLSRILGVFKANLGDVEAGLELQLKARELCREIGDERTLGRILLTLGRISERRGKFDEALNYLKEALAAARDGGDSALEGSVYLNQGGLLINGGMLSDASEAFKRALEVFEKLGDRLGKQRAFSNMGIIASMQARYAEARGYYQSGLELIQDIGNKAEEANMLLNLGLVCLGQGEAGQSVEYGEQAREIYRELKMDEMEGVAAGNIGLAEERRGALDRAAKLAAESLEIARACGNTAEVGLRLTYLGKYEVQDGNPESGLAKSKEGVDLLEGTGIAEYTAEGLLNYGQALLSAGRTEEGIAILRGVAEKARGAGLEGMAAAADALINNAAAQSGGG